MHRSNPALFLLALLLAAPAAGCGSSASNSDSAGDRDPGAPDARDPAGDTPPTDPVVAYPGGETSDFGDGDQPVCGVREVEPMDLQRLQELGFDPAAELAELESGFEGGVWWQDGNGGSEDADIEPDSPAALVVSVVGSFLERRESNDGQTACPDQPQYRALVSLRTLDRRLSGAFYIRLSRDTETGAFYGSALPDLRNFYGTLRPGIDSSRPHAAVMHVHMVYRSDGPIAQLQPVVLYSEEGSVDDDWSAPGASFGEPVRDHADGSPGAHEGVERFAPEGSPPGWDGLAEQVSSLDALRDGQSLDDYTGSAEPPTFTTRVKLTLADARGQVQVRVDGEEVASAELAMGEAIELGRLPLGTHVEAHAKNLGTTPIRLWIDVAHCTLSGGRCESAGCELDLAHTLEPFVCFD